MKRYAWLFFSLSMIMGSQQVLAGQYHATELGQALPMWMETLASINNDGDAAWTAWNATLRANVTDNATQAYFWSQGEPLRLSAPEQSSWAVGITRRHTDDATTRVLIAGSRASSQKLTDRKAILWNVQWNQGQSPTRQEINLAPLTPRFDHDNTRAIQQSAAYGVLSRSTTAHHAWIGGYARDQINRNTFPQPILWEFPDLLTTPETAHATYLPLIHPSAELGSGYVSSIAYNSTTEETWACGNTTGSNGAYNQATCWNITQGPASAEVYQQLNIDLQSTGGFGVSPTTSMVHRVRAIPLGSTGEQQTIAVGAALIPTAHGPKWKGWVYNLDTGALHKDLGLTTADHETFAYDVAGLAYEPGGLVIFNAKHRGLMVAGISSTTASAGDLGGLSDGLTPPSVASMRGVERRMPQTGLIDNGQVCAIDDDTEYPHSNYEQLLALSSDGTYRLAMANGILYQLTRYEDDLPVAIQQRQYTRQTSIPGMVENLAYFHAISTSTTHDEAVLRIANKLGCTSTNFTEGTCSTTYPLAFDIVDSVLDDISLTKINGVLRSAAVQGIFPVKNALATSNYNFAQIGLRQGTDCSITPVKASVSRTLNDAKDHPDDTTSWAKCASNQYSNYNTDIDVDVRHCGQCDRSADDQMTCTTNACVAGVRTAAAKTTGNECWVDGNNQWQQGSCVTDGALNPAFGAHNRCSLCDVQQSRADWSSTVYHGDFYQCVAHHDSSGIAKKDCVNNAANYAGAFYGDNNKCLTSDRSANRPADFRTNDYVTNHPCARFNQDTSAGTTNVNNATYWQAVPNGHTKPLPVWPADFFAMPSSEHNNNNNFHTGQKYS